jgi:hypothetical protein
VEENKWKGKKKLNENYKKKREERTNCIILILTRQGPYNLKLVSWELFQWVQIISREY